MVREDKIRNILFITLTNIGDVVLTLSSLDYLKYRFKQANITVLSGPNAAVLFSADKRIKENISYNKHAPFREKFALFNRLRKQNFDVIIDLRDTAFRWLVKAKYKNPHFVNIPKEIRHLRLRHLYKTLAAFKESERVREISIPVLSLCLDDSIRQSAEALLKKFHIFFESKYIVVAAGARSRTKQWMKEGFKEVCFQLLKQYPVVLLGDKNDAQVSKDINEHLSNKCIDLSGKTTLLEAVAIIQNANLVICNDSAISQISSYLNRPTLAIFGPTDEYKYGPLSDISMIARKNFLCTPCELDRCNKDWICMRNISPQLVTQYAIALLRRECFKPKIQFVRRVLISRTDRLGDVLLSTPVIRNLRDNFPGVYIAALIKDSLQDLLRGNPYLDEVITFDKKNRHRGFINSLRFAMDLRKRHFDLALILHPSLRIHLILFFSGIKQRIGYDYKGGKFLNTQLIKHTKQLGQKHETDYALDFLRELGIADNLDKTLYMPIYPQAESWLENLIKQRKLNNKIITIHSQASCPSKLWPKEYFQKLVYQIQENYQANIIYIGEKLDTDIKDSLGVVNLTGRTNLAELGSILKRSSLFISNDSGPVHMAVALNTPVISIFGRKQPGLGPKRWGPLGEKNVVLQKDIGCEVCLAHNCDKGFACLTAIKPEEVMVYVNKLLSDSNKG